MTQSDRDEVFLTMVAFALIGAAACAIAVAAAIILLVEWIAS